LETVVFEVTHASLAKGQLLLSAPSKPQKEPVLDSGIRAQQLLATAQCDWITHSLHVADF